MPVWRAVWRRCALGALLAATAVGSAAAAPGPPPADRIEEARQVLQEARRTATGLPTASVKDLEFRDFALIVIAGWQVDAQDVPEALKTASAIARASERAVVLSIIAEVQAKAGDVPGAVRTREQALQAAIIFTDAIEQAGTLKENCRGTGESRQCCRGAEDGRRDRACFDEGVRTNEYRQGPGKGR
jgi:hypothetical protein